MTTPTISSQRSPRPSRSLDLVLFGATGFTGKLVADHLAGEASRGVNGANGARGARGASGAGATSAASEVRGSPRLRWALAGRDLGKLEAVAAALRSAHPTAPVPELIRADAQGRADLDQLARRTRVVCTTAGPFSRYGSELVAACAAAGTDYCDITGEVPWVREMIDAHHATATATGARLVHFCGFDSIPSDLGTWALQQEMIARDGVPATEVTNYVGKLKGGLSGGTLASILEVAKAVSADREVARLLARPYALNPDPSHRGRDGRDVHGISYDRKLGALTMPFLMASTNSRAVRRSHALAGFPWGADFRYTEVATAPLSLRGAARAVIMTGGLVAGLVAASRPRLRSLLEKRMPRPGEGPSEAERDAGCFSMRLVGRRGADELTYRVADQADPGYGSTCKMLGQSALCLAFDDLPARAGSLTPSIAMGAFLLHRLREVGMTFEVESR